MSFLLDTNVISEMRKGPRANRGVREWVGPVPADELYLSVVVLGELRNGVERVRRRDPTSALAIERWLAGVVAQWSDRVLPVTAEIADVWGRLGVPDPLPLADALLAATARVHGLVLVTRDTGDMARTGVTCLNPFA